MAVLDRLGRVCDELRRCVKARINELTAQAPMAIEIGKGAMDQIETLIKLSVVTCPCNRGILPLRLSYWHQR